MESFDFACWPLEGAAGSCNCPALLCSDLVSVWSICRGSPSKGNLEFASFAAKTCRAVEAFGAERSGVKRQQGEARAFWGFRQGATCHFKPTKLHSFSIFSTIVQGNKVKHYQIKKKNLSRVEL